jgi:hypothetical protein
LPRDKIRVNFWQNNGLGNTLGDFNTISSGHPGGNTPKQPH